MKRILTALIFSLLALSATAQTQRVVVKTPGRQQDDGSITKGKPIAEAYVSVQGGNTYESDNNGELRMGKPSTGKYRFSNVRKEGYELSDADFLMQEHNYSADNTLYVNMDSGEELRKLTRDIENKVRRNYMAQLQAKTDEIERLRAEGKATAEELQRMQAEIDAAWDSFEKKVEEKAREYLTIDFDLTDDFKSEISYYIINGELQKADSMLATRGDLDERISRNIRLREQAEKEVISLAEECYYKHDICRQRFERDSAAYWLERRAELDPENVEWQMDAAEYICTYIGDYNRVLEYYNNALTISEKTLGIESPTTATIYNGIGMCYSYLGGYEIALEYYDKALSIREKRLGSEHPLTAISYGNIGSYYIDLNNYDIALEYYFKTLAIQEKVLDIGHPDTATTYSNIGWCYYNLDYIYDALEYFCKSMVVREVALGVEHHLTATSYSHIGLCCSKLGNYDEALVYHRKAMKILENTFGSEHPNTAVIYNNVGTCYNDLGDYEKALEYYYKALKINETVLGTEHPDTAVTYSNIGWCYGDLGDCDKALEYHNKALKIYEKSFGSEHPYTKITTEIKTSLKTQN